MHTETLTHLADTVTDKVGEAASAAHDLAHNVAERAPDLTSAVGRGARSSLDTVSDAVSELPGTVTRFATKVAALTPFMDAPAPPRRGKRWVLRVAVLTSLVGLAWWIASRRRRNEYRTFDASVAPAPELADNPERRYATAGR